MRKNWKVLVSIILLNFVLCTGCGNREQMEQPDHTATPTLEATVAPTETSMPEPTATNTPTPAPTATSTPTPVPTATNTPTPEPTATNTPTPEPTATNTPTPEPTATNTPTPKPTATNTPTPNPTATNTPTPKPTATNTPTPEPTATNTPTPVPTATNTPTPVPTATNTPTPKPTATNTPTPKPTATNTPTPVPTATNTPTPKPTATPVSKNYVTVKEKIDYLLEKLGAVEGKTVYFTVNQKSCTTAWKPGHECDENCKVSEIIKATWFRDLFGTVNVKNFPTHDVDGKIRNYNGYSCFGFACFAQWYVFADDADENVIGERVATITFNKSNITKNVEPGDVLRVRGHSMLVYSVEENGIYVVDSNWNIKNQLNCVVQKHFVSYEGSYCSGYTTYVNRVTKTKELEKEQAGKFDIDLLQMLFYEHPEYLVNETVGKAIDALVKTANEAVAMNEKGKV